MKKIRKLIDNNNQQCLFLQNFHSNKLDRRFQSCCSAVLLQIFREIFCKIKKLSYTNFYRNLVTFPGMLIPQFAHFHYLTLSRKTVPYVDLTLNSLLWNDRIEDKLINPSCGRATKWSPFIHAFANDLMASKGKLQMWYQKTRARGQWGNALLFEQASSSRIRTKMI